MKTLILNAKIINEEQNFIGSVLIDGEYISDILTSNQPLPASDTIIDAANCILFPGVIDTHVHFREPGLIHKADIESESRAAALGGVTTFFDMPNTTPQTTTIKAFENKLMLAAQKSCVNYSFFFGATNNNHQLFEQLNPKRYPGIKLFMGSSTGDMLVEESKLNSIFAFTSKPIVAHCEDTSIITRNAARLKAQYGEDLGVEFHPMIRSEEACYASSKLAVELAKKHNSTLHLAHISTEKELCLLSGKGKITGEAVIGHLWFDDRDYLKYGALIKCNPSIKTEKDKIALQKALSNGKIHTVATDHAPHLISEKQGGALKAASGMPSIQFSLLAMLQLSENKVLPITRIPTLMCHNPAMLFNVKNRGFIRKGYKADLVLVEKKTHKIDKSEVESKCKWSVFEGTTFSYAVKHTFCNGKQAVKNGVLTGEKQGEEVEFEV